MPAVQACLIDESRQVQRRIEDLARRLGAQAWAARPPSGGWSPAECVEHLNLTSQQYLPVVLDAMARAKATGLVGDDPGRLDLVGRALVWWLEPPYRIGSKTAPAFVPRVGGGEEVVARFVALQDALCDAIDASRGLLVSKIRVASPFDARLKYSLYSAFRAIPCHQRRHAWQAERAAAALR